MTGGHATSRAGRIAVSESGEILDLELERGELAFGGSAVAAAVRMLHELAHPVPPVPASRSADVGVHDLWSAGSARRVSALLHSTLDELAHVRGRNDRDDSLVRAEVDAHGRLVGLVIDDGIREMRCHRVEVAIVHAVNTAVLAVSIERADIHAALRLGLDTASSEDVRRLG
ncbi:hypothetical protein HQ325_09180 [Rhodococcus sp. BP-349]|uniref:hypothetical protein n=1 Tax=unclassified Rhodococcus (in: high G+C Gram-positive bacteria) TaxID=192944 RepID=UPI001C9B0D3E|nr:MULTISPECIES: hypothetical protein [unclassified Rhodococcus (in: high G+C Gram-positive bacteria)]MBY6538843.1 hypothetical protein [Rhodococcus sp. BP-363]MBY6543180.1 hypothetical protein [Rhodococcus sp. BP-369]MBY6562410.1 hypothetical protein [Rhodococcus sp. BP-370]MBY6576702.1 hypothetical protein [Rhodococcus sp. BP-364]MBY6586003.1 hypothetical protein [Rhodococcus sp. BP-358]